MSDDRWLRHLPDPVHGGMRRETAEKIERWLGFSALFFLIAALGLTVYNLAPNRAGSLPAAQMQRRTQHGPLRLRVDRSGTAWRVSWDPNADVLKNVRTAELLIDDGPEHMAQSLSKDQIRQGYKIYSPRSNDVVFQLQVSDQGNHRISGTLRLVQSWREAQSNAMERSSRVHVTRTPGAQASNEISSKSHPDSEQTSATPAQPVILNNAAEPAAPKPAQNHVASAEPPAPATVQPAQRATVDQLPTESPAELQPAPGKWTRVLQIFPKTARRIARLFRFKGRKAGSEQQESPVPPQQLKYRH